MAWTYQLKVAGNGGKWSSVNMRFPTQEEADKAGNAKAWAWTMCEAYRVVEVDEPANYRRIEGVNTETPPA